MKKNAMKKNERREVDDDGLPEMPEIDFSTCKIIGRGVQPRRKYSLRLLRGAVGLTQEQVAKRAKITQSEVSRAEKRADCRLSTLARYSEALGGELLLHVQIDGRQYQIML